MINRLVSERLAQIWGQQVLTLNYPGAGGSIAVRAASQAEPDGTTFFVGNASVFMALKGEPGVAPNLPVELPRDFTPIGFIAQQPMFIAVAPQTGIKSLPELIDAAKKRPGALSYATTGRGRITHLTMELLQNRAGIELQMIPYSGGPTAAMADVTTGRVAIIIEAYSGLAGGLQSGSITGIAVTSYERLAEFKDLATVAETLPGFHCGRLERAARARWHPRSYRGQGERRPDEGARRNGDQEQARGTWRLRAPDAAPGGQGFRRRAAADLAAGGRESSQGNGAAG